MTEKYGKKEFLSLSREQVQIVEMEWTRPGMKLFPVYGKGAHEPKVQTARVYRGFLSTKNA